MAHIAADRSRIRPHRNRLQPHPREGAQIRDEHAVVGLPRRVDVEIEGVIVLHQEFPAAHHAKPRPHLVAKLPLNLIQVLRQIAVAPDRLAEDVGDHFLVGRAEQHVAVVPVGDAQHLTAIVLVASAFAPKVGRLDRRHQHFLAAGRVHFLAHDVLNAFQHAIAERQPTINAGARLPYHAGAQHQPMRDDLSLARIFLECREKVTGQAHGESVQRDGTAVAQSRALSDQMEPSDPAEAGHGLDCREPAGATAAPRRRAPGRFAPDPPTGGPQDKRRRRAR